MIVFLGHSVVSSDVNVVATAVQFTLNEYEWINECLHVQSSISVVAMLLVVYKEDFSPYVPAALGSAANQLVFAFCPKTKAYRALYTTVSYTRVLLVWFSYLYQWVSDQGVKYSIETSSIDTGVEENS